MPTITGGPFSWLTPPDRLEPAEGSPVEAAVPLQGWTSYPLPAARDRGGP